MNAEAADDSDIFRVLSAFSAWSAQSASHVQANLRRSTACNDTEMTMMKP